MYPGLNLRSHPTTARKNVSALWIKDSTDEGLPSHSRTSRAEEEEEIMGGREGEQRNSSHHKVTLAKKVLSSFCHFCLPSWAP